MLFSKKKQQESEIDDRENLNSTEVDEGFENLHDEISKHKGQYIILGIINFVLAFLLVGYIPQTLRQAVNLQDSLLAADFLKYAFSVPGFIFIVLLMALGFAAEHKFIRAVAKDYTTDKKRNYDISHHKTYGSAGWQTEKQREECFFRAKRVEDLKHDLDILGIDDKGLLYTLRDDLRGLNKNIAIVGAPGAGKSVAIVTNHIYQNIRRGHSMVVTDSKGDLYKTTAYIAKKHGYIVKVLNLKANELKNSDGCDFLKFLGDDDVKAQTLANTIIRNTSSDDRMDYWAVNEMNYLKALLLYISNDPARKQNHTNTLPELFNYSSTHTLDEIKQDFSILRPDDPAKQPFNIFTQCKPEVQGQIANGMNIRLQTLGNKWMQHVAAADEIDLTLPMKKKCIYYVVISDLDTSFKFIATLFFAEIFMAQGEYSDSLSKEKKKNQLPVSYIMDEFANTGSVPEFDHVVTTVRSRKIGITMILQDIGQLESMYPKKVWNTIMNGMATKVYLSSNDPNTAEHFSGLRGTQTVRMENRKYSQNTSSIIHFHDTVNVSEGLGKRELMMKDELMNDLSSDDLIVTISGHHPVMLHKYISTRHPMDRERFKEVKVQEIDEKTGEVISEKIEEEEIERIPARHKPKWRKVMETEQAERDAKSAALQKELEETEKQKKPAVQSTPKPERNDKSEKANRTPMPAEKQTNKDNRRLKKPQKTDKPDVQSTTITATITVDDPPKKPEPEEEQKPAKVDTAFDEIAEQEQYFNRMDDELDEELDDEPEFEDEDDESEDLMRLLGENLEED